MRKFLIVAAVAALSMSAAFADDDVMATRYGNTTVVKMTNGTEVHFYYNADHTFTGNVIGMNYKMKGTWAVDGDKICSTYDVPPPGVTNPQCNALEAHKVGDTWQSNGRTITLVEGVQ
jgi:opacity protein-like surface antigen